MTAAERVFSAVNELIESSDLVIIGKTGVIISGKWTGLTFKGFDANTLLAALEEAVKAQREALK